MRMNGKQLHLAACISLVMGCSDPGAVAGLGYFTGAGDDGLVSSECAPTVCESGGVSKAEAHEELEAFYEANPTCTEIPTETLCRNKSIQFGEDWPDQMQAQIQAVAEQSGGFLDGQMQALRCLGFMEPSDALQITPGDPDARVPSQVTIGLEMPAPAEGKSLQDEFLSHFGMLVGTILHVTDDYEFEPLAEPDDNLVLRFIVSSYKGIAVDPENKLRINVDLGRVVWQTGASSEACPDRWMFSGFSSTLSRNIETVETDPAKLIPGEDAVAAALADCGACSHPADYPGIDSGPDLLITTQNVLWRVVLRCSEGGCDEPGAFCTYRIDAQTQKILSNEHECCMDCY